MSLQSLAGMFFGIDRGQGFKREQLTDDTRHFEGQLILPFDALGNHSKSSFAIGREQFHDLFVCGLRKMAVVAAHRIEFRIH